MGRVTITFLGATSTVTGSRFLVTSEKSKILVDAGLFQGVREVRRMNWEPFPVEPSTINAVLLTHAHLDHCGYMPLLVRNGFMGPIFATAYTEKLSAVILRDSAYLQQEDARFAEGKGFSKHSPPLPLYDIDDVEATLKHFSQVAFRTRIKVTEDAHATFFPSGHILGSAFVLLEIADRILLFTSDMGRSNHPLLSNPDPAPVREFDAVITESTYGDRIHDTPVNAFANELNSALQRGGTILIPAFAVDRTEVILMALHDLIEKKLIANIPIYVDSPMALKALDYYREAIKTDSPELRLGTANKWKNEDPFDPGKLSEMRTVEESKTLANLPEPSIIISASGMATGGRVVHHLANLLPDEKNTVILVGFQAAGSRGRSLEEGEKKIKIHGRWVPVKAAIAKVESFSVHADSDELIKWLGTIDHPKRVFIVHGEPDAQSALASRLRDKFNWRVDIPKNAEVFEL